MFHYCQNMTFRMLCKHPQAAFDLVFLDPTTLQILPLFKVNPCILRMVTFSLHVWLQLEVMAEPQVWRDAATQVFFALGLGFGGVIAFSSYNKRDNNCHFDALLVSFINFLTSVLATLVVFAVLGFKANIINNQCIAT